MGHYTTESGCTKTFKVLGEKREKGNNYSKIRGETYPKACMDIDFILDERKISKDVFES